MKVLQIHKWHFLASGADRAYFSTSASLEKRGVEVAHFATAHPNNVPSPWSKYFPKYHDFSHFSLKGLLSAPSFIWNFEAARCLEKLLQEFKPDVAHLHNIYHHLTPSILKVLKRHNIPVVLTVHDFNLLNPNYMCYHDGALCQHSWYGKYWKALFHNCVGGSFFKTLLSIIQMSFDKWHRLYEKNVDIYILYSRFFQNKFLEAGFKFKRADFIPMFILDKEFYQATSPVSGQFAFTGRLIEEKGVSVLLEALKLIKTKIWQITFIGDGPMRNKIASAGYKVLSNLNKAEREQIISRQIFMVAPSVWWDIAFFALMENYGVHRTVIASRIGGIPEYVEDGMTGLLVDPNNPALLAEAIDTLLQQPQLANKLGENGFHLAKDNYNEQLYVERLLKVYGELI